MIRVDTKVMTVTKNGSKIDGMTFRWGGRTLAFLGRRVSSHAHASQGRTVCPAAPPYN